MLCRRAEDVIERWLDAVYYSNPDRKSDFTSDYYRRNPILFHLKKQFRIMQKKQHIRIE